MMGRRWRTNDDVETPRGYGVVQGWVSVEGEEGVLVRIGIAGENAPECRTPRAKVSSLWVYPPEALKPARERRRR